jgi:hypothetical protein
LQEQVRAERATILALMVLQPPTIDHDASVLCQLLMSTDPELRARAHALLDQLGADARRAAVRLALMKQEDKNAAVQAWVAAGLLRLGWHALAELQRQSAADEGARAMLASTIQWLQTSLGG